MTIQMLSRRARATSRSAFLIALLFASLAYAQPSSRLPGSAAVPRRLAARDVFDLKRAEDVQISPDGKLVAYVRAEADIHTDGRRRSIWIIDRSSQRERELAVDATGPRWSPMGSDIAFIGIGAVGRSELRVVQVSSKRGRTIANLPGEPSAPVWSPDGTTIAFTRFVEDPSAAYVPLVAKPTEAEWAAPPRIVTDVEYQTDGARFGTKGNTRLFVVPSVGGDPRQLTSGTMKVDGSPVWLRDGRTLLFTGNQSEAVGNSYSDDRIFSVGISREAPTAISPAGLGAHDPDVSPDGQWLTFTASKPNDHDYQQSGLYLMEIATGRTRKLAPAIDREIQRPRFSADGSSIYFIYGNLGHVVLARLLLRGNSSVLVSDLGDDGAYSLAADGTLAFASEAVNRPADVAVRAEGGAAIRLTGLNEDLLGTKSLATARSLIFRSGADGVQVHGLLLLAPTERPGRCRPMILSIHGGPHGFDERGWSTQDQLFAAAGYAVLHVDYRGSLSYGFAFADGIARDFPGAAYEDLMSGIDAVVADGMADPNRLFVIGGSAGGELTAWTVGRTHRFRAAVAVKPVINAISESLTTVQYGATKSSYGTYPWQDIQAYWRASPLSLVDQVTTPTLLMVGENDRNTPAGEAEQFYDALKLLGKPTALVIVPDAGHGSIAGTPSREIAGVSVALDWFARHGGLAVPVAWTAQPRQ